MSMRRTSALVTSCLLSLAALGLGACGGDSGETVTAPDGAAVTTDGETTSSADPATSVAQQSTDAAGSDTAPAADPGVPVPDALQFSATLVGGEPFDAATLAGRPVAMWFWAPG